jgi:SAM-dependent methyltransferase
MLLREIYYFLSPQARFIARRLLYYPIDAAEALLGKRDALTPPRGWIYTGRGAFKKQGELLLKQMKTHAGLAPNHHVLDVGSGIGRVAAALTSYLEKVATYEGFDVVRTGVDWCSKHISRYYPNFNFRHAPLKNDLYRSDGADAAKFSFPYPDQHFDFVIVVSVFTHLLPLETTRYLREISRVLRPEGSVFATFFLFETSKYSPETQNQRFPFPHDHGHYRLMHRRVRSANVAYEESYLWRVFDDAGLAAVNTVRGYWRGGAPTSPDDPFQDIVVLRKKK